MPPSAPSQAMAQPLNHSIDKAVLSDAQPDAATVPMLYLLSLQAADGSFGWNDQVTESVKSTGVNPQQWRTVIVAAIPPSVATLSRDEVVNTVVAIEVIRKCFPDHEALWRRSLRKTCREYLPAALSMTVAEVDAWLAALRKTLGG